MCRCLVIGFRFPTLNRKDRVVRTGTAGLHHVSCFAADPMNALLLYPQFPKTFWSFDRFLAMAGVKTFIPPLGILTVAALLPADWNLRFMDRNVAEEPEADWHWCDLMIVSAMMVQREDFHQLIRKAVGMGKKVAVGGPYPTSLPEHALQSGAHYLILDEGEITVPPSWRPSNEVNPAECSGPRRSLMSASAPCPATTCCNATPT